MKSVRYLRRIPFTLMGLCLLINLYLLTPCPLIERCMADSDDAIIATVNGVPIMKSELDYTISKYLQKTNKDEIDEAERHELIKNLIRHRLILQQDAVQALRNDEVIAKKVKNYEDRLVVGRFLKNEVGSKLAVSDEEVGQYYKAHRHEFSSPRQVKSRHILLRTQKEAEEVLSKLQQGADFGQMAKDYSIDLPNALEGGTMGVIKKGTILPELEKELFTLNKGEISGIIHTRFGYHILTVDEIIPVTIKPLEEVEDQIRRTLIMEKEAEAFDLMAAKLEKDADIKISKDIMKEVVQ